jgi:NADH:ubiquinone oxidoreductase subunit C
MHNEEQGEQQSVRQDEQQAERQGEQQGEMHNEKPQVFIDIAADELRERIEEYGRLGWRFVNICGSTVAGAEGAGAKNGAEGDIEGGGAIASGVELIYSFSKGLPLENLRFTVDAEAVIPSISDCFPNAFFFENETHDLFGVKFSGISIDFDGAFYTVAVPTPMNPYSSEARETAAETLKARGGREMHEAHECGTSRTPSPTGARETPEAQEAQGAQGAPEAQGAQGAQEPPNTPQAPEEVR